MLKEKKEESHKIPKVIWIIQRTSLSRQWNKCSLLRSGRDGALFHCKTNVRENSHTPLCCMMAFPSAIRTTFPRGTKLEVNPVRRNDGIVCQTSMGSLAFEDAIPWVNFHQNFSLSQAIGLGAVQFIFTVSFSWRRYVCGLWGKERHPIQYENRFSCD